MKSLIKYSAWLSKYYYGSTSVAVLTSASGTESVRPTPTVLSAFLCCGQVSVSVSPSLKIHLFRYSNDRNLQHAASLSILLLADFTMPNVYRVPYLVPWPWWRSTGTGPVASAAPALEVLFCCLQKSVYFCSFWVYKLKNTLHWKGNNTAHGQHKCFPIFTMYNA